MLMSEVSFPFVQFVDTSFCLLKICAICAICG